MKNKVKNNTKEKCLHIRKKGKQEDNSFTNVNAKRLKTGNSQTRAEHPAKLSFNKWSFFRERKLEDLMNSRAALSEIISSSGQRNSTGSTQE